MSDKSMSIHNILHSSYLLVERQWVAVTCLYGYGEDVSNAKQLSCKFIEPDNVLEENVAIGTDVAVPIVR